MAQSLYIQLRARYPDRTIDVLAPAATLSLVQRMPEINRGIRFDFGHGELKLGKRKSFAEGLKPNAYQQAIILPNSLKSALVPMFANIPLRTGFRGEFRYFLLNDMRMLNKRQMPRMIDRFVALGTDIGETPVPAPYPQLTVNQNNLQKLLEKFNLKQAMPVLAICPGAEFGDAKKWPEAHYARLADLAIERGMQVWIFGGPNDQKTAQQIKSLLKLASHPRCVDFTAQTSLLDVIDLLSVCQLVVSNDSGLMHIAAAVGCATTVIYGSTSAAFTPPLTEKLDIFSLDLDCSPCFKRQCPLKHKACLQDLMPDRLIPVIEKHGHIS